MDVLRHEPAAIPDLTRWSIDDVFDGGHPMLTVITEQFVSRRQPTERYTAYDAVPPSTLRD
ncbi:hypothetical protein ACTMTJ_35160 [Phytohabitans sp. LJ34]|uniref:hypothetical protein n=1 Tax=Phytohabitans sp. LJ34 TaxID=3452217 RepID=UPI003F8A7CEA